MDNILELHSPMTQEEWDKITDVELEHTNRIWFTTPSGKEVTFIPLSVIENIKADISSRSGLRIAVDIIDKHMSAE